MVKIDKLLLGSLVYVFNGQDNGGEAFALEVEMWANERGETYMTQELHLQSYGNSATLTLGSGMLTPGKLRTLADKIDALTAQCEFKVNH